MGKIFFVLVLFLGSSVFAATKAYDLKVQVSHEGQAPISARIVVKAGEVARIMSEATTGEKTFIDVVANEGKVQGRGGIMMKFTVGTLDKKGVRGKVSKPQIMALENEEASITVDNENGQEQLHMSVVAQRKTL